MTAFFSSELAAIQTLSSGLAYQITAYYLILHALLSSADFFQNKLFRKILSGIPSECETAWIQIRPDTLSGLIWVQTVLQRLSAAKSQPDACDGEGCYYYFRF